MTPCSHWNGTLETKSDCATKQQWKQNLVVSVIFQTTPDLFRGVSNRIIYYLHWMFDMKGTSSRNRPVSPQGVVFFYFCSGNDPHFKDSKIKTSFFWLPPPPKIVQWTGLYKPIHGEWHAIYFGLQNIAPSTRRDRPAAWSVSKVSYAMIFRTTPITLTRSSRV